MRKIVVQKCQRGMFNLKCKMLGIMPETEHVLFVVYAGVEALHLPATFWWVNVGLFVSGTGAFVYRRVSADFAEE